MNLPLVTSTRLAGCAVLRKRWWIGPGLAAGFVCGPALSLALAGDSDRCARDLADAIGRSRLGESQSGMCGCVIAGNGDFLTLRQFFNVVRVSDSAVGVFVCDVMGHGVRAALVTAMMRTLEEQLAESAGDPGGLLTAMNAALRGILRQLGTSLFTTACYVIVDIASARLSYANAGHPSPLLVSGVSHGVEPINGRASSGPALGLLDDVQYRTCERPVAAGDLILAFTDGLFEVENVNAETFTQEALREVIQRHALLPPAQLVQDVFSEIERFAGEQAFRDDVCLVGMEVARLEANLAMGE